MGRLDDASARRALADGPGTFHLDPGVVHFDAHADTADEIDGNLASRGTPMRRLVESGAVLGRNFVQVELRGYWPPAEVFSSMRDQQMRDQQMDQVWARGLAAVLDDAVAEAMHGCVALDVAEVCPPYDVAEITVNTAHRVVLELLVGLAVRRAATPTTV